MISLKLYHLSLIEFKNDWLFGKNKSKWKFSLLLHWIDNARFLFLKIIFWTINLLQIKKYYLKKIKISFCY